MAVWGWAAEKVWAMAEESLMGAVRLGCWRQSTARREGSSEELWSCVAWRAKCGCRHTGWHSDKPGRRRAQMGCPECRQGMLRVLGTHPAVGQRRGHCLAVAVTATTATTDRQTSAVFDWNQK